MKYYSLPMIGGLLSVSALIGCQTVTLPHAGEHSPPTIKVSMPGTEIGTAYGTSADVNYLREDETGHFRAVNPNKAYSFLVEAEDFQSGVKNVSVVVRARFKCRVQPINEPDRMLGFPESDENLDRSYPPPGPGDTVQRKKFASVSVRMKEANEICANAGGQQAAGRINVEVTAVATNYFDLSDSKVYQLIYSF